MTTTIDKAPWQEYLEGVDAIKATTDPKAAARLIEAHNLPREVVPTELLKSKEVWEALLVKMPMTALIRNLATLTRVGVLAPMSDAAVSIATKLVDAERLKKARVHPIQVLAALKTYESGQSAISQRAGVQAHNWRAYHGVSQSGGIAKDKTWTPVPQVVDALNEAFYLTFDQIEPTGKRYLLGLDVSGSMDGGEVAQVPGLTPRVASSAMAMVTARSEAKYQVMAFSTQFIPLSISPKQRLDDICKMTHRMPFGGTDCALPMRYAEFNKVPVDVFVVYTDSETWAGNIHPSAALESYRQKMGINARLVVVGMVANQFTIADPNDPGMMDVVGFDTAVPEILRQFALGNL